VQHWRLHRLPTRGCPHCPGRPEAEWQNRNDCREPVMAWFAPAYRHFRLQWPCPFVVSSCVPIFWKPWLWLTSSSQRPQPGCPAHPARITVAAGRMGVADGVKRRRTDQSQRESHDIGVRCSKRPPPRTITSGSRRLITDASPRAMRFLITGSCSPRRSHRRLQRAGRCPPASRVSPVCSRMIAGPGWGQPGRSRCSRSFHSSKPGPGARSSRGPGQGVVPPFARDGGAARSAASHLPLGRHPSPCPR